MVSMGFSQGRGMVRDSNAGRGYVRLPRPSSSLLANSKSRRSLTIAEPDA